MAWYFTILIGAGAAVVRIVYGWATRNDAEEEINWLKIGKTLVAGIISGAAIGFFYKETPIEQTALAIFLGTITLDDLGNRLRTPT